MNNPNNAKDKEYNPDNDPEVTDSITSEMIRIREKLLPYQRYIMLYGLIILIFLVVFLGFAYGGLKVCSDLDGLLDSKFKCHLDFEQQFMPMDRFMPVPGIIFNATQP